MASLLDAITGTFSRTVSAPLRRSRQVFRRALRFLRSRPGIRQTLDFLARQMPKGLYARSLLIIIMPVVLLQSVVAYVFMERHWQTVTWRLSSMVTQSIASIIDVYESYPQDADQATLTRIAGERLGLTITFLPPDPLPPATEKPFFSLLDRTLSQEISRQIGRPFWIDTVGKSNLVEIRIRLEDKVLRVFARRSQTYASNSHIFIAWMVGTSLVLLGVALIFMRNQVKPIQQLADAAEAFGKGRDVPKDFKPSGAREVRRAATAFLLMRERIERQIEQRTTMLAGVSHDLRTILTRFKLQLALVGDEADVSEMTRDVDEMQHMLEDYMAFARGDSGEQAAAVDIEDLFAELSADAEKLGRHAETSFRGHPVVVLKPNAFKRCLSNLVANAIRFADKIRISGRRDADWLTITVDDDGPGIPEDQREAVFKPFFRLDDARNQDLGGTGLGLAIALDIARAHGGEVTLEGSPLGGLRAIVRVPV
ncbi:MAG: HAMP domain-containing protein [Rhodobiaceae bacterium]|nr:HAMP domain-containing protein [Rhodobiaceae bacterium]MCC0042495.1 HAMP domain-containing protein [Rhodobiaceae bacterium]